MCGRAMLLEGKRADVFPQNLVRHSVLSLRQYPNAALVALNFVTLLRKALVRHSVKKKKKTY